MRVGYKDAAITPYGEPHRRIQFRVRRSSTIARKALSSVANNRLDYTCADSPHPLVACIADQQRTAGVDRQRIRPTQGGIPCRTAITGKANVSIARKGRNHSTADRPNALVPGVRDVQRAVRAPPQRPAESSIPRWSPGHRRQRSPGHHSLPPRSVRPPATTRTPHADSYRQSKDSPPNRTLRWSAGGALLPAETLPGRLPVPLPAPAACRSMPRRRPPAGPLPTPRPTSPATLPDSSRTSMNCARILLGDAPPTVRANNGFGLMLSHVGGLPMCLRAHGLYKR